MSNSSEPIRGWCSECEAVMPAAASNETGELICPSCGEAMVAESDMTPRQKALWKFIQWGHGVMARKQWGPSPGGAAGDLGCSRATVDDLVRVGILERNEYDADGHKFIMISSRSIERAKDNMKRTGRWTGIPGEHHAYE